MAQRVASELRELIFGRQYLVVTDYDLLVEDAIAAGHYDQKNSNTRITNRNFPSKRMGTRALEIILVKFKYAMSSEDVLRELDKHGLRPAELPELLAFGERYPDVQREFPVVALGSVWQYSGGRCYVPYLSRHTGRRGLYLSWLGGEWFSLCRFAVVRK
jgi:hypothetical protein